MRKKGVPVTEPEVTYTLRHKNKRDYCRGKEGLEHSPKCVDYNATKRNVGGTFSIDWKLLVCTICGKELDFFMPNTWGKPKPVPAWVTEDEDDS
jgi:hypothetical protein